MEPITNSPAGTRGVLTEFWENLTPREGADKAWLHVHAGKKSATHSYKDLVAQANCLAAWLMHKGLQSGETVAVIARPSAFCLVTDLALQFAGAVILSLPEGMAPSQVAAWQRDRDYRFVFVQREAEFRRLDELSLLKPDIEAVILGEEDVEFVSGEKLATFEPVVTQGKHHWRENADGLRERKASVRDHQPCLFQGDLNDTYGEWARRVSEAAKELKAGDKDGPVMCLLGPEQRPSRTHGLFGPMLSRRETHLFVNSEWDVALLESVRPGVLIIPAAGLSELYKALPALLGKPEVVSKQIREALEIIAKCDAARRQNKKAPFFTRLKYNRIKKGLLRRIVKKCGGRLTAIYLGAGAAPAQALTLFREAGIRIVERD